MNPCNFFFASFWLHGSCARRLLIVILGGYFAWQPASRLLFHRFVEGASVMFPFHPFVGAVHPAPRPRRRRIQPSVEVLEDRTVPAIQAVSTVDPAILSLTPGGTSSITAQSMSAEGRYVVFHSAAANIVKGDTNGKSDIFVRDNLLGTTIRVSTDQR
jgi:hypothetical protein